VTQVDQRKGEMMGYSRERIRQLQHGALDKLRKRDRDFDLADYLT